jgi:hypothetical protein
MGLVGVVLLTLIAFSLFFVGFLLAPLAVLLFFALIFYSRNRSTAGKGRASTEAEPGGGARSRLIAEARARQAALTLEARRSRTYEGMGSAGEGLPAVEHIPIGEDGTSLVSEGVSGDID